MAYSSVYCVCLEIELQIPTIREMCRFPIQYCILVILIYKNEYVDCTLSVARSDQKVLIMQLRALLFEEVAPALCL